MLMRFKAFCAPKRFVFVDPDSQYKYAANTKKALIQIIVSYRAQNGLETIEELDLVLENYWCMLPENVGLCEPLPELKRGLLAYLKGGVALLRNFAYNKLVPIKKAEERAAICIKCPHNAPFKKNTAEKMSDALVEASVGKLRVSVNDELYNCEICTCNLRAKVFFGGKLEFTPDSIVKFPDFCWQKIEYLKQK